MTTPDPIVPSIMVVTDNAVDAELIKKHLEVEFDMVAISTDPDKAVADFELHMPDVLMLAYNGLGKSERYYLELYRRSRKIHSQPHRTVILCNKDEVKHVYELCKKELFDDYILFWPMTHDTARLPMSVHHAARAGRHRLRRPVGGGICRAGAPPRGTGELAGAADDSGRAAYRRDQPRHGAGRAEDRRSAGRGFRSASPRAT